MDQKIENTINALLKNGMKAQYFESGKDVLKALMQEISCTDKVGIGGSITVKELGIPEAIRDQGNELFYHWFETTPEGMASARRNAQHADVYIAGTNAITEDGKLVNMDGSGNRVSSLAYGPKRVFVICGENKIVKDERDGIKRIEDNAWKNAVRLGLETPCVKLKSCTDCTHPQRMCNILSVIRKKPGTDLTVFIIGEDLGY